ncbi:MAG: hypothetical protein M1815_001703 [Lichina confinis]|nr:MAG: hypothetical protein M1815_001703 [Lichina confinis]
MIPPEPSLQDIYHTFRLQKDLANKTAFNKTPKLPQPFSARVKSVVRQTWQTCKRISGASAIRRNLDTDRARHEQKKATALKAKISRPIGPATLDESTAMEHIEQEQEEQEQQQQQQQGQEHRDGQEAPTTPAVGERPLSTFSALRSRRGLYSKLSSTTDLLRRSFGDKSRLQSPVASPFDSPLEFACAGETRVPQTNMPETNVLETSVSRTSDDNTMLFPLQYSSPRSAWPPVRQWCPFCEEGQPAYTATGLCQRCSSTFLPSIRDEEESSAPDESIAIESAKVSPLFSNGGSRDSSLLRPVQFSPHHFSSFTASYGHDDDEQAYIVSPPRSPYRRIQVVTSPSLPSPSQATLSNISSFHPPSPSPPVSPVVSSRVPVPSLASTAATTEGTESSFVTAPVSIVGSMPGILESDDPSSDIIDHYRPSMRISWQPKSPPPRPPPFPRGDDDDDDIFPIAAQPCQDDDNNHDGDDQRSTSPSGPPPRATPTGKSKTFSRLWSDFYTLTRSTSRANRFVKAIDHMTVDEQREVQAALHQHQQHSRHFQQWRQQQQQQPQRI